MIYFKVTRSTLSSSMIYWVAIEEATVNLFGGNEVATIIKRHFYAEDVHSVKAIFVPQATLDKRMSDEVTKILADRIRAADPVLEEEEVKMKEKNGTNCMVDDKKLDQDKIRMDLLPLKPLSEVAKVMQFVIDSGKYKEGSWKDVPEGKRRYMAAGLRHTLAMQEGEVLDPETKLLHAAHKAASAIFELHFVMQEQESDQK